MMFASPKNKGLASRPAKTNEAAPNPVEQALRQSAAWEPDCPPPADFAHFTRCALEKRARNPFPPASNRPAPSAQWVLALRAPLAASLALGLVLWVGGNPSELPANRSGEAAYEVAQPVLDMKPAAPSRASQTAKKSVPLVQTAQTSTAFVRPTPSDEAPVSSVRFAQTSYGARSRRHKRRGANDAGANRAGELLAARDAKKPNTAPLWKTETMERPAWGALIPATFACAAPAVEGEQGNANEEATTLMPVVLDVALPETANLAAVSSTDAPPAP